MSPAYVFYLEQPNIVYIDYSTHNNIWNFQVVCASLNLNARIAKSSIYYCEQSWGIGRLYDGEKTRDKSKEKEL